MRVALVAVLLGVPSGAAALGLDPGRWATCRTGGMRGALIHGHRRPLVHRASARVVMEPRSPRQQSSAMASSEEAGVRLFLAVIVVIAWLFTLPPEIRRTHVCTTDVNKVVSRYECKTPGEFADLVVNHYRECTASGSRTPCVQLDFSVDPRTLEFNAEVAKGLKTRLP